MHIMEYRIDTASVNVDTLPLFRYSRPYVVSTDLDSVEIVNHQFPMALDTPIELSDTQVDMLRDQLFIDGNDTFHLDYNVEIRPKKPVQNADSLCFQYRHNKLLPIFKMFYNSQFHDLISILCFFFTSSKISSNIFTLNTFHMKDLRLELVNNNQLSINFVFEYSISIKQLIYLYLQPDILSKLNTLIELLYLPNPTQYQCSCNQFTAPPTVSTFYSLITDNTNKYYNDPTKTLVNIPSIDKILLPFQIDSVQWMLNHEGIQLDVINGEVKISPLLCVQNPDDEKISEILDTYAPGWTRLTKDGSDIWFNPYCGSICTSPFVKKFLEQNNYVKSSAKGFLCEEMGLGKTLEITTLIKLNPRLNISPDLKPELLDPLRKIKESKTTLILCPETIINQWYDEIVSTCTELSVYIYKGISILENEDSLQTPNRVANKLNEYDIVLTSYSLLSKELDRAIFRPTTRPKRASVGYERIDYSSPLMLLEFHRLILDEAQLASISISRVAYFSRIIPRLHTWCVSGTLIRKNLQDLNSLIKSERMYPLDRLNLNEWNNVPRHLFDRIFKNICIRHTKEMVGTQVNLPKQKRVMLRSPFSTIESDNYENLFNAFLQQVGLNQNGEPTVEGFDYERSRQGMRTWSSKLRMICNHAMLTGNQLRKNMFQENNLNLQNNKKKDSDFIIGTLDDVLDDLINNNELESSACFSNYIRNYIKKGKINEFLRDPEKSVIIFNSIITELNEKIEFYKICQKQSKNNERKKVWNLRIRNLLECLHQSCFMLASAHYQHYRPMRPLPANFTDLIDSTKEDDHDDADKAVDIETLNDDERKHHELETFYYSKADEILNILLDEPLKKTSEMIEKLNKLYSSFEIYEVNEIPCMKTIEVDEEEEYKVKFEKSSFNLPLVSKYFPDLSDEFDEHSATLGITFILNRAKESILQLNEQSTIINYWFMKLYEFQKIPVVKEDADKTGEEYKSYLLLQEQSQGYIDQIQLILDDREKAINSTEDSLSNNKSKLQRVFIPPVITNNNNSLNDELEKLRKYLIPQGTLNARYSFHTSILELVGELQEYSTTSLEYERLDELIIILKNELKVQLKNVRDMRNKIFEVFNDTFNSKISYFKSLQIRSDSLVNYSPEKIGSSPKYVALMELETLEKEIKVDENKMQSLSARLNYLKSLNTQRETDGNDDNLKDDSCVICRYTILVGTLTPCGHKYCRDCLNEWMKTKKVCPICQKKLKIESLYNFTYSRGGLKGEVVESLHENKEEVVVKENNDEKELGDEDKGDDNDDDDDDNDDDDLDDERLKLLRNRRLFEKDMDFVYQGLPTSELREISNIKLKRSYGTKVDMIIRQVKYLISKNDRIQILIFSQWNLFLLLLGKAMKFEDINFRSWMDQKITNNHNNKLKQDIIDFKKDSTISCFLLNTVAQAAGLTFTNASHVFLCEPIVNLSFELQAINRIHRIGQTKETTVWNFIIEGTIEESIAYLGTKKRIQSAKIRTNEGKIEEIDDNILEAKELTKVNDISKTEGEVIGDDDLWAAFFAAKSVKVIDSTFK